MSELSAYEQAKKKYPNALTWEDLQKPSEKYLSQLANRYGFAWSNSDIEKGLRPLASTDITNLQRLAQYNWTNNKDYDFGGLDFDPTGRSGDEANIYASLAKKLKRIPTQADYNKYYTTDVQYKGQYGNAAEDQAAYKAGQAPMRVQYSEKLRRQYNALAAAYNAGNLSQEKARELAPDLYALTGYAKEQEAAQARATAGGKGQAASYPSQGTKQSVNVGWLDPEVLKLLGYDEKTGFAKLFEGLPQTQVDVMEARLMPTIQQKAANARRLPQAVQQQQALPVTVESGFGNKGQGLRGNQPFGEYASPQQFWGEMQFELAQKNPEFRKQYIEKNAFNPDRQKEIIALTIGSDVVSPEEYVKALETKDATTIAKFRQQLANNPRVAQFTPDQEERIFRASEKWQNMPSEVKSMLAFVQGLSDALASPVPLSMFGLPSDNAAELGEQAASRKFIGDIGESAKSLGMMRRALQEESPNAYDWGQLASMAVPVFGLESSVIKGLPKNVRLANEAEEALGRQAVKIIEEINDADMSRYVDYFTRPGAPSYAQAAENALIRGIGAVEGLPARGLSNAQKLRMVEDAMRRRFPKTGVSAADDAEGFLTGLKEGLDDLTETKNIGPETIDFAAEGGKAGGGGENIFIADWAGNEGAGKNGILNPPKPLSLSDTETRRWYLDAEAQIPDLIDRTKPLEQQARQASALRNQVRTQAREAMTNRELANSLFGSRPNMTWEEVVKKYMDKGYVGDELYQEIMKAALRSNSSVNQYLGVFPK